MENFKKHMNIVDKVLNALFIAFLVVSIVTAVFAVIGFIGIEGVEIGEIDSYLTFGALKLSVEDSILVSDEATNDFLAITALIAAGNFAVMCGLVKELQKMITPMKDGDIFHETVHKSMKHLAVYILICGVALESLEFFTSLLILTFYDIGALFNPETVWNYSLQYELNGDFIVFAAVVYLLSYVFKYGTELQTQVDETL